MRPTGPNTLPPPVPLLGMRFPVGATARLVADSECFHRILQRGAL